MPEIIEQLFLEEDARQGKWMAENLCRICDNYIREHQCSCGQEVCDNCWSHDEECCVECVESEENDE